MNEYCIVYVCDSLDLQHKTTSPSEFTDPLSPMPHYIDYSSSSS